MKKAIFLLIGLAATACLGCGSSRTQIDALRADNDKALEQVRGRMDALAAEMRRMREDLRGLDSDLFELRGYLDVVASEASDTESETASSEGAASNTPRVVRMKAATVEGEAFEPITADPEVLAAELTKVRDLAVKLQAQYNADKELADLRDPRQTWEAMGDPKQLSARLDRFAEAHAATIEDATTRDQFLADVAAVREQMQARANMTVDEQAEDYYATLTERINAETNDRRRQFYERQAQTLTSGDTEAIQRELDRATRFENARAIGEIAQKYDIPRETLRDNGLAAFGGFGDRGGGPRGGGRTRGGGGRGGGGR